MGTRTYGYLDGTDETDVCDTGESNSSFLMAICEKV